MAKTAKTAKTAKIVQTKAGILAQADKPKSAALRRGTALPEPAAGVPVQGRFYVFHAVNPKTGRAKADALVPAVIGQAYELSDDSVSVRVTTRGQWAHFQILPLKGLKLVPITREQAFNPLAYEQFL